MNEMAPVSAVPPVTIADIEAAAARLDGHAVRTPLLEMRALGDRLGARVLVKPEPLQRTGSFKFRGAFNRCQLIPAADRARGVVAFSSGNHAQGVAASANIMGMPATIVMPADAPAIKRANTIALGAEVVDYDRAADNREAIAADIIARTGATLIRPYDDPGIIAGQGTVGLEIAQGCQARGIVPDIAVTPVGGGGLIAGTATALTALVPGIQVLGAEPAGYDDTARSLAAGERVANDMTGQSFCDALLARTPGELTFSINRRLLAGGRAVTDAQVATAMREAFETLKIVVEPGGAVALAALLAGYVDCRGKTVVVVLSGGNVDREIYAEVLAGVR